jgi:GT2 family glycosyltransferase/cephalosporin hydroxylase
MLSIVIPTYNEGSLLTRTLESVLSQPEAAEAEIVIADDGSTDGSVVAAVKRWPQIRHASHPKPYGTSAGKALGADTARGDVLLFLDAHTCPAPGAIATLTAAAKSYGVATPAVDGLDVETWRPNRKRSAGMYVDLQGNWHCLWINRDHLPQLAVECWRSYAIPGQSFAIRRDVYDAIGGWDRGLLAWGSDASLSLRLWCLGYNVVHVPSARVAHRFASGFSTYRPHWWEIFANRNRILRSLGTPEEIETYSRRMRDNQAAYRKALEYTDQHDHTIQRLHGRCVRSLTEYADTVYGTGHDWLQIEGWLSLAEGQELQRLAAGKRVLEIGSYRGRSTVCLATVAEHVTAVDPHDAATLPAKYRDRPSEPDLRANLAKQGLTDRVQVIVAAIQDVASTIPDRSIDLVYIDGDHSATACARDLQIAQRVLVPGGAIAVHDYTIRTGVRVAVDQCNLPLRRVGSLAILHPPTPI